MMNLKKEFLQKGTTIALVGASNNPDKYGFKIFRDLTDFGYQVVPIHPTEPAIQGVPAFSTLTRAVKDGGWKMAVVNFVVPPAVTLKVLQECLDLNLKKAWFQPGASDAEVLQFCATHEFCYVHDACMMVEKYHASDTSNS